ncbi:MAG: transposase, partial [Pseudomonadota bacterium]
MRHVASLDVSLEESAVCVLNGEGDVVGEKKVETEPEAIAAYLSAWSDTLAVVGQEAGGLSPWLHRGLVERGLPAVCIETRRMKAFAKGSPVKTDRRDAKMIAQALLAKLHQEVH